MFDALREVEWPGAVALHSVSISEHEYKRWGEIDFVVLAPEALIAMEVKGGGISCRDGMWTYTNRNGVAARNSEGPFRQVQTALMALHSTLKASIGPQLSSLAFGYGVIFPQSPFDVASVEWPAESVLDQSHFRSSKDLLRWLQHLVEYTRASNHVRADAPEHVVRAVLDLLRPQFERVPSLSYRVDSAVTTMDRLTEDQYHQLDLIEENERILVKGGAGTGKTFLAAEVTRRSATRGQATLVTAWSDILCAYLRSRLPDSVDVVAFDALDTLGPDRSWDYVVVDEGQDLLTYEDLASIDRRLRGGLERGRWCFFFDSNNQSAVRGHFDTEALSYLAGLGPVHGRLSLNCRNTREVATQTKVITGGDLGVASAGSGPAVEYRYYRDSEECAELLEAQLADLTSHEVPLGEITILSPGSRSQSCVSNLSPRWQRRIKDVDKDNITASPLAVATFARIDEFKGLENKYICLVDIDRLDETPRDLSMLYVGMSRARASLWIALNQQLKGDVEQAALANFDALMKNEGE